VPNGTITYTYDATGQKLRKVAVINGITTTTEYIAGIQYKNSTTAVDFIQTEEGKAVPSGTNYDYTYYLGDNLGNSRRTFDTQTGVATTQQVDDYYPFGLEINGSVVSPKNEYLYNKKELQEELSEYDYGARFYDPVIGRWNVVDPLAEVSRRWSPYNYVENNPIRLIDPDGMSAGNPMAQTQDDDPGKENENSKKKTSLDYDLQYAANKAGFELGKSESNFGGDFVGEGDDKDKKGKNNKKEKEKDKEAIPGLILAGTGEVDAALLADDVTVVGAADDFAIPFVTIAGVGAAGAAWLESKKDDILTDIYVLLAKSSGKNERHGDSGALSKVDKQIKDLETQLANATNNKDRVRIKQKIKNVRENAQRQRRGEEHSRANKR